MIRATFWAWPSRCMSAWMTALSLRLTSCAVTASMTLKRCVSRCRRALPAVVCAHRSQPRCSDLRPTSAIAARWRRYANRWRSSRQSITVDVVRGEIFRLPAPRGVKGREQRGARYAVIVQADEFLGLSTALVSPTSTSAAPASFRPTITLDGIATRVLVEQTTVVDPQRLGETAGRLDSHEMQAVDEALSLVLGL